jgi:hypothetical protein
MRLHYGMKNKHKNPIKYAEWPDYRENRMKNIQPNQTVTRLTTTLLCTLLCHITNIHEFQGQFFSSEHLQN